MKSKLESIAGFLAGREDGSGPLRAELDDPSSEASRFLEATRARSRSLLTGLPPTPEAGPSPGPRSRSSGRVPALATLGGLLAVAGLLWAGEVRHRRLEVTLERDRAAAGADLRASEARLTRALEALKGPPTPEPPPSREPAIEAAIGRLEASLDQQARRLDDLARSAPATASNVAARPDPILAEIRAELVLIRREAAANEVAGGRQFQELRTIVQELNQGLRRLLGRAPNGGQPPMLLPGGNPGFSDPR